MGFNVWLLAVAAGHQDGPARWRMEDLENWAHSDEVENARGVDGAEELVALGHMEPKRISPATIHWFRLAFFFLGRSAVAD